MDNVKFRVVILTAGQGNRLGNRTTYFNKSLLRVGNKAVISHAIDMYPEDTEFVIALGYKGNIVKQYLEIAHPTRKFIFVDIDKYSVPGSGPFYALNKCKEYLQCPFFFWSCDTLVKEGATHDWLPTSSLTDIEGNWVGTSIEQISEDKVEQFCTIELIDDESDQVMELYDKSIFGTTRPFIGLAFIKDYEDFWNYAEKNNLLIKDELQLSPVLSEMIGKVLRAKWFHWWDTGSEEGLKKAREDFPGIQNLDKLDEELYVLDDTVVKYFHNSNIVRDRVYRAKKLGDMVPAMIGSSNNFYKYSFIPGKDLFKINNQHQVMLPLLNKTKQTIWKKIELSELDKKIFKDICKTFYYNKTVSRLEKLASEKGILDSKQTINDVYVPLVFNIFNNINWDYISDGIPVNFHGDYNLSNIVLTENNDFRFLDWRQDFGGCIDYGDIYYDFAKMYHSFLLPHESVKHEKFYVSETLSGVKTFIEIPVNIEKAKDVFEKFITSEGYDLDKVKMLTAIVLLNMSPLHEAPLDKYLFYFSKSYLYKTLREKYV
jgi:hypothetical protein